MKTTLAILGSVIGVCVIMIGGLYLVLSGKEEITERNNNITTEDVVSASTDEESDSAQTEWIGGENGGGISLGPNTTEDEIIALMHYMTHQKVKAYDKWGAFEMSSENIDKITKIVEKSDFDRKTPLLNMLNKWKAGNFNEAVEDHNYLWKIQGGTIGEAYELMSEKEEAQFVYNNFR